MAAADGVKVAEKQRNKVLLKRKIRDIVGAK